MPGDFEFRIVMSGCDCDTARKLKSAIENQVAVFASAGSIGDYKVILEDHQDSVPLAVWSAPSPKSRSLSCDDIFELESDLI